MKYSGRTFPISPSIEFVIFVRHFAWRGQTPGFPPRSPGVLPREGERVFWRKETLPAVPGGKQSLLASLRFMPPRGTAMTERWRIYTFPLLRFCPKRVGLCLQRFGFLLRISWRSNPKRVNPPFLPSLGAA